ncbi:DUF6308 family protein [Streptomyces sp. NPDC001380]|uniref:DUF6308 family protein n=1 Tax=Streptomyces sp. NPDC001380 TaxID=3364566 RepID=UPI0036CB26D7
MASTTKGLHGPSLRALFENPSAQQALTAYFHEGRYTGARFERLAVSGCGASVRDRVTAADLVAVQLLGVQVPAEVSIELLEGPLGDELAALLSGIPADLDLAHAAPDVVDGGSAADRAWRLLRDRKGMGETITSKLLARKRPRLLPVIDDVVRCVLGWPKPVFWSPLREELRADGHALEHLLLGLRKSAGLPEEVSALRVFDVVLWMRHHEEHSLHPKGRCTDSGN